MRPDLKRFVASTSVVLVGGLVIIAAQATRPEAAMRTTAKALIAALTDEQRAKIRIAFDAEERMNWQFVPIARKGLPLKEMTEPQRKLAFDLLKTGLSAAGYTKAEAIRSLENVLRAQSGSATRDPELYFFSIFGDPDGASWGWRYEGHHLSQNWTIAGGKATATTPAFFGANPAEVMDGPMKGTRALAAEDDLARAFMAALTDEQRKGVIVTEKAPTDIVTGNSRRANVPEPVGLVVSSLDSKQQALLMKLIEEHASSQPAALAEQRLGKVRSEGWGNVRFAWMGSTVKGPGNGHYYRIQGKTFLIEYDNVQNQANHQHIVWRDFAGDFGTDVLAEHYASVPHTTAPYSNRVR
jgi:Protein of unknown function (DUF3500)